MKLTLHDLNLEGRRALVRVDFNVPLTGDGSVTDDTRLRGAVPTIEAITGAGAKAILMSHLGRPGGERDVNLSLHPVQDHLQKLLDQPVHFAEETVGEKTEAVVEKLPEAGVLLLENTRFHPGEKANDADFAAALARLGDLYVGDAFGAVHRAHASTVGAAEKMKAEGRPAAMGLLVEREVEALSRLMEVPGRPFVAVLGGVKVSDKIGVIETLLEKADRLLIGGAMSYTFMKALGRDVGASRVEDDRLNDARRLYESAAGRLKLPADHLAAESLDEGAPSHTVSGDLPEGTIGVDIGPETSKRYREDLLAAETIVWNGPMGIFEREEYADGTRAVAQALAEATEQGALTVAGGGDSAAALTQAGLADRISHLSTGGGAMLRFLEGKSLPGIEVLSDR